MRTATLAFIGGGNMARALIGGLLARGVAPASIRVADPAAAARRQLSGLFPGIAVGDDNLQAARQAERWVLAVKPQDMPAVARSLAPAAASGRPLVISIAAGIRVSDLRRWLGPGPGIVRCMPNRPALLGAGITALYAGPGVDDAGRGRAAEIMAAVGEHLWVDDEALLDAVTAVSGSGPAYVFLLIEMLEAAAQAEGLPPEAARRLAVGTVHGAARMAHELPEEPRVLREQVTSRGGTTDAALRVLEQDGVRASFLRAVHAATLRSRQLADEAARSADGDPA